MSDNPAFKGSGLIKFHRNGYVTIEYPLGKADGMDCSTREWGVGVIYRTHL